MPIKTYPSIKSRILQGYTYPSNYPAGLYSSEGTGRNDTLPTTWLNVPLSFKSSERAKIAGSPAFLGATAWRSGFSNGYNDSAPYLPTTNEAEMFWIIRPVTSGGYTIELEKPLGGLKYLAAPDVCFTPLNNPEAALADEPWPKAQKDSNGNPIPHKYAIQGPEWHGKKNGGDGTTNGMSFTPGWYPLTMLSASPNEFTTWYIQRSGDLVLLSTPKRSKECGTRLGPFPWKFTGNESAGQKAVYQDYYRLLPVGAGSPTWTVKLKPSTPTATPTGTPVPTDAPTTLEPAYYDGSNNTSIGINLSNKSDNATNIMNQSQGGGGSGGVDATTATLLASLLAAKSGGSATYPEVAPGVIPYPNPYAQATYATNPPSETPAPEETVDPTVAAQEAILQQLMSTPAPIVKPWYATPVGMIGIACLVALLGLGVWFFFFRKKGPAGGSGSGRTNSGGSSGFSSRPRNSDFGDLGGSSYGRGSGGSSGRGFSNSSAFDLTSTGGRGPIDASIEASPNSVPAFERVMRSGTSNGSGSKSR